LGSDLQKKVEGRDTARAREKYLKSGIGKEFLKSLTIGSVVQRIE
jgi:hypothetical protein